LGRAGVFFPLVGLVLGMLLVAAHAAASALVGPALAAVLVVALWAALTGGLHLDGLADCCDGLLVSAPRERRLEILRDPRVGSFAVTGVVLALLLKTAAVYSQPSALPGLLLAPVWARWWILLAARRPAARPGGLGSSFAETLTTRTLALASLLPLVLLGLAMWWNVRSLIGVALGGVTCLGVLRLAQVRIGGVTGDVLGAVVELSEIALLVGLAQP
jgi:adenosylcobinamide-GDP ribazoletransferase